MATAVPYETGFSRWVYILWGILSIVAGFFLLTRPAMTSLVLIEVMAIFWIVGGIFDMVRAISDRGDYWGWRIVAAIIGIIAGLYIIGNPVLGTLFTISIAFILLAIYSVIAGIINIIVGIKGEGAGWGAIHYWSHPSIGRRLVVVQLAGWSVGIRACRSGIHDRRRIFSIIGVLLFEQAGVLTLPCGTCKPKAEEKPPAEAPPSDPAG
jgi:uncharacterized membrane protein HdeD (DUF308 family)